MSNCAGCEPGCSGESCGGTYSATDFVHAVDTREAARYDEPVVQPMVLRWRGKEGCQVRCSDHESGTLITVRERDRMLLVEVDAGRFWYPMRTTEEARGE